MQRLGEKEAFAALGNISARWSLESWAGEEYAKDYSTEVRRDLAKKGQALSDGSYPIKDAGDLKDAATLAASGHGNVSGAKALIRKRAKQLGVKLDSLPGFGSESSAQDPSDQRVTKAIEAAIAAQELDLQDEPDAQDRQVLALLKQALAVQRKDLS